MQDLTGIIFNIVHGSFVDGYGVRTTVFLKGCPLRCLWCCNPEGQKFDPELRFISADCNHCGKCVDTCPAGAISFDDAPEPQLIIDRDRCTVCGKCTDLCPMGALGIVGKRMTVSEVIDDVTKDCAFYRNSGGGVTIGGGEATAQPDFTLALVRELKSNYIHTAIDTCGFTTSDAGLAALKEADLLLYDLKCIDPAVHKNNTGVSNEIILKNLLMLDELRKAIIIRFPFIPGYNDSDENVAATVAFLEKLRSVQRVDIIGYHDYSRQRYSELGMEYPLAHVRMNQLPQERLEEVKTIFERHGLCAQLGG